MTLEEFARLYYDMFNQRRFDEAGLLVHGEAVFHYIPTKQRLIGRAGYRALAASWVIAFEDAQLEIQTVRTLDDHTVVVDFIGRGTHTGDLTLGEALTIPATGRRADLAFRDTLEVRDGLIVRSSLDFAAAELRRKLTGI
jgi:predicted ester cyclase